jgi:hypothetical protein
MIELAPKATAEINPKMAPSMARLWHIYNENEIELKFGKYGRLIRCR